MVEDDNGRKSLTFVVDKRIDLSGEHETCRLTKQQARRCDISQSRCKHDGVKVTPNAEIAWTRPRLSAKFRKC